MNYPRGLIRYSTENAVSKRYTPMDIVRRAFRPQVIIYSGILVVLVAATSWSLKTRVPLKVNVLKDRSTLSREADDGSIENIYRLQIMNTGDLTRTFRIGIAGIENIPLDDDQTITVTGGEIGTRTAVVKVNPGAAKSGSKPIRFSVEDAGDPTVAVTEARGNPSGDRMTGTTCSGRAIAARFCESRGCTLRLRIGGSWRKGPRRRNRV